MTEAEFRDGNRFIKSNIQLIQSDNKKNNASNILEGSPVSY